MKTLVCFFTFLFLFKSSCTQAQILNADRYEVTIDSTKPFKALLDIGFSINKQNTLLFSLDSKVDLSYARGQNLWVIVGQFKLFRSGSKNLLNGGFAHARSRFFRKNWIHPEVFAQYQLDGVRGMELRLLGGANARFTIKEYEDGRFHLGLGAMYELERWNYSGVPNDRLPSIIDPVINHFVKVNSYLSFSQKFNKLLLLQVTAYLQFRPDSFILYPRLSIDGSVGVILGKHVQFTVQYTIFHDSLPVVPIDQLFFTIVNKLTFSF